MKEEEKGRETEKDERRREGVEGGSKVREEDVLIGVARSARKFVVCHT